MQYFVYYVKLFVIFCVYAICLKCSSKAEKFLFWAERDDFSF